MISLKAAAKKAKEANEGLVLDCIYEYKDLWTFAFVSSEGDEIINGGPTLVEKKTGRVGLFFPPDYSAEYLDSGKEIPLSEVV